ncbi:MAG: dephospho-CoA kinase [Candidatus Omnitrophota bacterium]
MIIGVTGSFGSGKTTVARMFARLGAYIIDADRICRSLMMPRKKVYKRIVRYFGNNILKDNRAIDRKKLAVIVFGQRSKLRLLNRLVHPEAIKEINKIIRINKKRKVIVVDAALLVESDFYKDMDRLIVVRTDRDRQLKRIMRRSDMTQKEILERIGMQAPLKKKMVLADFIIDNSGSRKQTLFQVEKFWKTVRGGLCQ